MRWLCITTLCAMTLAITVDAGAGHRTEDGTNDSAALAVDAVTNQHASRYTDDRIGAAVIVICRRTEDCARKA